MMTPILQIIGSLLGIVATWYLGKVVLKYRQAYQDGKSQTAAEDARKQAQKDDQGANQESDDLKKIDGR